MVKIKSKQLSIALGRLKKIRNVRYIYLAHVLIDILEPIAKFNKKFQSDNTLVCEFKSHLKTCLNSLSVLNQSQGKMEASFWKNFNENNKEFKVNDLSLSLEWNIGPFTRTYKQSESIITEV